MCSLFFKLVLVSILFSFAGNLLQISSSLNGAISAPLTGVFLLAGFIPFSNAYGAFFGMISGLAFGFFLSYGAFVIKPEYPKLPVNTECYMNMTGISHNSTISNIFETRLGKEAINLTGWSKFFGLSYTWYSTIGIIVTILIGIIVSLATGGLRKKPSKEEKMTFELFRKSENEIELANRNLHKF
jgi:sodium-coupled monocarboxylate transporter 8/12